MLYTVVFVIDEALHYFLPAGQRGDKVVYRFKEHPAVKDAIEALGIPHTEVKYILLDDSAIDFDYQLQHRDEITVYSHAAVLQRYEPLIPAPPVIKFVLDVHLGKLARLLRLLGFDTLYDNQSSVSKLIELSTAEQCILLTRSVGLLKHKEVVWGYCLHSEQPEEQLKEVIARFKLANQLAPFTRCMVCNGSLHKVSKEAVIEQLLPKTRASFTDFWQCEHCHRIYWQGSHFERMASFTEKIRGEDV